MDAKAKCYCFTIQCELISEITGVDCSYEIPDILWYRIVPLLLTIPHKKKKKKVGRPRMNDRQVMSAIFYILRTGCQWNALPRSLGASSTVHDRFQEWRKAGVFKRMWIDGLLEYDKKTGIDWEWQAMDGWCYYEGTTWGKKVQVQIQLTGLNQVQNAVF